MSSIWRFAGLCAWAGALGCEVTTVPPPSMASDLAAPAAVDAALDVAPPVPDLGAPDVAGVDFAGVDFNSAFTGCPRMYQPWGLVWAESPNATQEAWTGFPRARVSAEFRGGADTVDRCPCAVFPSHFVRGDMANVPDAFAVELPNPGVIDVTARSMVRLVPNQFGLYRGDDPNELFGPGEAIRFAAAGGRIPAFQGGLDAPHPVTVTWPRAGANLPRAKGEDLVVTWSGGAATPGLAPGGGDFSAYINYR